MLVSSCLSSSIIKHTHCWTNYVLAHKYIRGRDLVTWFFRSYFLWNRGEIVVLLFGCDHYWWLFLWKLWVLQGQKLVHLQRSLFFRNAIRLVRNIVHVLVCESRFDKNHSLCPFSISLIYLLEKVVFVSPATNTFRLSIHCIWNLCINDSCFILGKTFHPSQKVHFLCQFLFLVLVFYCLTYDILLLGKNLFWVLAIVLTKSVSNFASKVYFLRIWNFRKPFFRQRSVLSISILYISRCKYTFLFRHFLTNLLLQKFRFNIIELRNHNTIVNFWLIKIWAAAEKAKRVMQLLDLSHSKWLEIFCITCSQSLILTSISNWLLIILYRATSPSLLSFRFFIFHRHTATPPASSLCF